MIYAGHMRSAKKKVKTARHQNVKIKIDSCPQEQVLKPDGLNYTKLVATLFL